MANDKNYVKHNDNRAIVKALNYAIELCNDAGASITKIKNRYWL